jgi:hypothetical protein
MSALALVLLALTASDEGVAQKDAAANTSVSARSGGVLKDATLDALRRWEQTPDDKANAAAREFLKLYQELGADRQMPAAQRQSLTNKVRGKLTQLSGQISRRVAKEKRAADVRPTEKTGSQNTPTSAPAVASASSSVRGGAGGGDVDDTGDQLVELIQRTIRPASWDAVGGPGTIYYWRQGRFLVVRQTEEGHEEIDNVLNQLRRASN